MHEMSRDNLEMRLFWVLAAIAIVLFATPAYADGIDIGGIFMGVDSALPVGEMIRLICLLMLLNYALNFAVIGVPAVRVGPTSVGRTSLDLIWLTLLAQIADRAGSLLALLAAALTSIPLSFAIGAGLAALFCLFLLFSLLFCGYFVWVLAFYFLRKRWQVSDRAARRIAGAAAILTNPVWVMFFGPYLTKMTSPS
jgi:hypothetical protein